MRVLITGSRDWASRQEFARIMHREIVMPNWVLGTDSKGEPVDWVMPADLTLVTGAADGIDSMARDWMIGWDRMPEEHPADWSKGRSAGIVRNHKMVVLGADLCLAFITRCTRNSPKCRAGIHGSHGASHCAAAARQAGIETRIFKENW